jgi:prepilin-type N-terminal cleavage/methylation domain-containing protein
VKRRGGQRGFTLLELLITLSVTTIGLVGLLSLHLSVARGNDGASRSAEAQQIASSQLEALRSSKLSAMMQTLAGTPTFALPIAPKVETVVGRASMTFTLTSSVAAVAASASLMRIRVVAAWTEDGGTTGTNSGQLDHAIALEVIRTMEEQL